MISIMPVTLEKKYGSFEDCIIEITSQKRAVIICGKDFAKEIIQELICSEYEYNVIEYSKFDTDSLYEIMVDESEDFSVYKIGYEDCKGEVITDSVFIENSVFDSELAREILQGIYNADFVKCFCIEG